MAKATSRDPDEWAKATSKARTAREKAAREIAQNVAQQVYEQIVEGDTMGGRGLLAQRIKALAAAEQRGDTRVTRAALMEICTATGSWIAALDLPSTD